MDNRNRPDPDDDIRYWYTPQSVFFKGPRPNTRLRCFEQLSEEQAERRHRVADVDSRLAKGKGQ